MMVLLLALAFAAADSAAADSLDQCIERSNRACVSALLSKPPQDTTPEYWAVAARGQLLLGKRQAALAAINRAVDQKPGDFDLLMEQGWINQKCSDQVAAIRSFLTAGRIQPRTPAVFYELGMSFFLLNELSRSANHFHRVLELNPQDDKAEFMLGILDVVQSNEAAAKPHFERALSISPSNPHYLLHYGVLLRQLNEPAEALANMRKAEDLDPSNPLCHFNLGRLYRQMNKLPDAERELREAVRLRPGLGRAYYELATVYRSERRMAEAATALDRFSKLKEKESDDDPLDSSLAR